jgi:hypothetical protein
MCIVAPLARAPGLDAIMAWPAAATIDCARHVAVAKTYKQDTLDTSDHLVVWAELSIMTECNSQVTAQLISHISSPTRAA